MAIRKILTIPDPLLEKSESVKIIDKDIQNLMDDMIATMYKAPELV